MEPAKFYEPFEGWLFKKGTYGFRNWKKRWFSLRQNVLYYYSDPNTPKGKIILSEAISIHPSENAKSFGDNIFWTNNPQCYFQIDVPSRSYFLYASTRDEMQRWVDALNYSKSLYSETSSLNPNMTIPIIPNAPPSAPPEIPQQSTPTAPPSVQPSYEDINSLYPQSNYGAYSLYMQQQHQPSPPTSPPPSSHVKPPTNNTFLQIPSQNPELGAPHVEITEPQLKEIMFTEGDGLKKYIDQFIYCCGIIMGNNQQILPQETEERKKIILIYLALRTLDWENRDSFGYSYGGYEKEKIFPFFNYAVQITQQTILSRWMLDGPTILTKIDTWIKRKRSNHQILFLRGDRESILKWNIALLYHVQKQFLANIHVTLQVENAVCSLVDELVRQLDEVPSKLFTSKLWHTLSNDRIPREEKSTVKSFLEVSLVIQKLKMENDEVNFTKHDPYLHNAFERVLGEHTAVLNGMKTLQGFHSELRSNEMKIFGVWRNEYNLLHTNPQIKQEQFSLYLKNQRILKRLGVKANKFPKLQEALWKCAIDVENRMPKLEQVAPMANVPFPNSGEDLLVDLLNSLKL